MVVAIEKLWSHGLWFARLSGYASLVLAVVVVFVPGVAPGLDPDAVMGVMEMDTGS